jgi:hypothetical protein
MGEHKVRMNDGSKSNANRSGREHLQAAQVHLICWIDPQEDGTTFGLIPYIVTEDPGWNEVIDEGYDHKGSPLGPVYWRIVKRNKETLYLSTFLATRDEVIKGWGLDGLRFCDPVTGTAVARIESSCSSISNDVALHSAPMGRPN